MIKAWYNHGMIIHTTCQVCKKEFKFSRVKGSSKGRGTCCSIACSSQYRKGKHNSPTTQFGGLNGFKQGSGEANSNWKGTNIGVGRKHVVMNSLYGKPKKCETCGNLDAKRYDWANLSGEYKMIRSDWKRLCRSCHVKLDKNWLKKQCV